MDFNGYLHFVVVCVFLKLAHGLLETLDDAAFAATGLADQHEAVADHDGVE